jgi:cytochrome c oxidase cbb3-type subunit 3
MSQGLGIFITIAVLANIGGALWLIWWTARGSGKIAPQETTHVWDDDLTEYNNPLPRWWLWLFLLSILFALCYLAAFPGLGKFPGLAHWTEVSQYQQEDRAARRALELRFAAFNGKSLTELSKDAGAMATAKNLFALNCSACHGSDARGAKGFPNLTDQDWLWGGSEQSIYRTISQGRDGLMPAWGTVLGHDRVEQVMAYVLSLSGRTPGGAAVPAQVLAAGKTQFAAMCAACHGADGTGNQAVGGPNLTDKTWLYGGSANDIRETITNGRTNHMPAHLERLGDTRVRLLAAYVLSLSRPVQVEQAQAAAEPAHASL